MKHATRLVVLGPGGGSPGCTGCEGIKADRHRPQDDDRLVAIAVRRVRAGDVLGALRLLQP